MPSLPTGARPPTPSSAGPRRSGHYCEYERVSFWLDVGAPGEGTTETVGDRRVAVTDGGDHCELVVERPLPGREDLVERATLRASYSGPVGSDADCRNVRAIGELLIPELPR